MLTEDVLRLMPGPDGPEVGGFEVGGLWTAGYPAIGHPAPPLDLWPDGTTVDVWRMHGAGWVTPLWRFAIKTWPQADAWPTLVRATLDRMIDGGASIAWMANDHTFADPPGLFDPAVMGDQVLAATSTPTGFARSADLGQSVRWLPPTVLIQLHAEVLRLVDPHAPDPDDHPR